MTARETLRMFARIKAVPPAHLEAYIEQLLVRVGVRPHADRPCGTYSGGNKRKLSLAVALVGRPLVAFLDEPSTGMDPVARRHMWGVIGDALADTSVVLTSHSMEECEALCHRLGVMVSGRFRCLGSTQRLKSRFGDGYALEIKCLPADADAIKAFVQRTSRGAVLEEEHGGQLKYKLPRAGLTLSSLFAAVEAQRAALGIRDYSVSQPTLEQVFLSMARQQEEETEVTEALRPAEAAAESASTLALSGSAIV
jgi:ABC-type multidrug transport system ATPase subunit